MKLIYIGDFKRLKEFGFKKDKFLGYLLLENENDNWDKVIVAINEKTRVINIYVNNTPDEINDLIKAGLVRKEEE